MSSTIDFNIFKSGVSGQVFLVDGVTTGFQAVSKPGKYGYILQLETPSEVTGADGSVFDVLNEIAEAAITESEFNRDEISISFPERDGILKITWSIKSKQPRVLNEDQTDFSGIVREGSVISVAANIWAKVNKSEKDGKVYCRVNLRPASIVIHEAAAEDLTAKLFERLSTKQSVEA